MRSFQKGFTLIELLVVIGIVGILLSITLVAINPARQFRLANDAARSSAVNTISSAIVQLILDNKGVLPTNLQPLSTATYQSIWSNTAGTGISSALGSLCSYLTGAQSLNTTLGAQTYISKLPVNPTTGYVYTSCTNFNIGYSVKISNGRVWVATLTDEPSPAGGTLEVSR